MEEKESAIDEASEDKVLKLTLPPGFFARLKAEADKMGVQPQSLAKTWLYEALKLKTQNDPKP